VGSSTYPSSLAALPWTLSAGAEPPLLDSLTCMLAGCSDDVSRAIQVELTTVKRSRAASAATAHRCTIATDGGPDLVVSDELTSEP